MSSRNGGVSCPQFLDGEASPLAQQHTIPARPRFGTSVSAPSRCSKSQRVAKPGVVPNSKSRYNPLPVRSGPKLDVPRHRRAVSYSEGLGSDRAPNVYVNSDHQNDTGFLEKSSKGDVPRFLDRTPGAWVDDAEIDKQDLPRIRGYNRSVSLGERNKPGFADEDESTGENQSSDELDEGANRERKSDEKQEFEGPEVSSAESTLAEEDGDGSIQDPNESSDELLLDLRLNTPSDSRSRRSSGEHFSHSTHNDPSPQPKFQIRNKAEPPNAIANSIFALMKKPVDTTKRWKKGSIYVASIKDRSGYVKIGYTSGNINKRLNTIFKCLGSWCFENVPDESHDRISYHDRTERLIFADLMNERRTLTNCSCKMEKQRPKEHGEFFEIEASKAHSYVKKWRDWMDSNPYDQHGMLENAWADRIGYFTAKNANMDALKSVRHTDRRWDPLMKPSYWENLGMKIHAFLNEKRSRRGRLEAMKGTDLILYFRDTGVAMVLFCTLRTLPLWTIIVVFSPLASLAWTLA